MLDFCKKRIFVESLHSTLEKPSIVFASLFAVDKLIRKTDHRHSVDRCYHQCHFAHSPISFSFISWFSNVKHYAHSPVTLITWRSYRSRVNWSRCERTDRWAFGRLREWRWRVGWSHSFLRDILFLFCVTWSTSSPLIHLNSDIFHRWQSLDQLHTWGWGYSYCHDDFEKK